MNDPTHGKLTYYNLDGDVLTIRCHDCGQTLCFKISPRTGQIPILIEPHDCCPCVSDFVPQIMEPVQ